MVGLDDTFRAWFWGQVEKTEHSCWLWVGEVSENGYGVVANPLDGKLTSAQRMAWVLTYGPIERTEIAKDSHLVCHTCDFPICVAPHHLYLGTYKTNARDREWKGRAKYYVDELSRRKIALDKTEWVRGYMPGCRDNHNQEHVVNRYEENNYIDNNNEDESCID